MIVPVKVLNSDFYRRFQLPAPSSAGAAGLDLRAALALPLTLWGDQRRRIPTGLAFAVPEGYTMLLVPRSGLGNIGIVLSNLVGVVDSDYRGEVQVSIWNASDIPYTLNPGDRIAQALFMPVMPVTLQVVEELPETVRGANGFGSSGVA